MPQPKIAVMLDENTSRGGTHYETHKDYFSVIAQACGIPYGIPYLPDMAEHVVREFDGFFSVGGSFAFPADWYLPGHVSPYPPSERLVVEIAIMKGFLAADKPVLGACNGMQVLAALHGCKLRSDLETTMHGNGAHMVNFKEGTRLAEIVGKPSFKVNSRHREAVAEVSDLVRVGAIATDGGVEAIELPNKRFAFGYQWHQENLWRENHAGNRIFGAFIVNAKAMQKS